MKTFTITITCEVTLPVERIWPDGDAPDAPVEDDVIRVLREYQSPSGLMRDWNLDQHAVVGVNGVVVEF